MNGMDSAELELKLGYLPLVETHERSIHSRRVAHGQQLRLSAARRKAPHQRVRAQHEGRAQAARTGPHGRPLKAERGAAAGDLNRVYSCMCGVNMLYVIC